MTYVNICISESMRVMPLLRQRNQSDYY